MHRAVTTIAAAVALAAPATAAAAQPTQQDRTNAAQECRAERGSTAATREAFAQRYGTARSGYRNAFGRCVSRRAADEARETEAARTNAAEACRAERGTTQESRAAFAQKYGTNRNRKNAFGRCVSQQARAQEQQADAADAAERSARRNAARTCREERGTTAASREAFARRWGTERSGFKNAFGRCVSQTAKAPQQQG